MAYRSPVASGFPLLAVAAAATAVAALLGGCAAPSVRATATGPQAVEQVGLTSYPAPHRPVAPALRAVTLTGDSFALSSTLGSVVVLNVWASWCGPCRSESPALARAAASFSGRPVKFVGIDEQDDAGLARKFVRSTGAGYPNLVDSSGQLLSKLSLLPQAGVPSTLVLDRHGRIADRVIGPVSNAAIMSVVTALLKES